MTYHHEKPSATSAENIPLIWADDLNAPLATHQGTVISRRQYLTDAQQLADNLPASGPMLNLTADRYRFAVGLGAALLRGQHNLLPPNHASDTLTRLQTAHPTAYGLTDLDTLQTTLPLIRHPSADAPARSGQITEVPSVAETTLAAQVLTSGSSGTPIPHHKYWGSLHKNIQSSAQRLAQHMGRSTLIGVSLVATVPPQHMFGFESSVLLALLAGATFDVERPFFPADIAAALARAPHPRMLVTTPFHLKTLLDSGLSLPPTDLTLCATAPLSPQLAARAEAALAAPLLEIYGCTEAGQVATRRTTAGAEWQTFDGLRLSGNSFHTVVQGGHVLQPTPLPDVLEVINEHTFRLLGRTNDLINIAGKRSSLAHLNYHLNMIDGVEDGTFWLPSENLMQDTSGQVVRLIAFVVAPQLEPNMLTAAVLHALRQRLDSAFLPRRIIAVSQLPRENSTGKLPITILNAWAEHIVNSNRHTP
jgi:acyl-coenzyme A synthetase/AMP-(fatty) acid ligase